MAPITGACHAKHHCAHRAAPRRPAHALPLPPRCRCNKGGKHGGGSMSVGAGQHSERQRLRRLQRMNWEDYRSVYDARPAALSLPTVL